MLVRILYTNGTKTIVPFWVRHDGKDIYFGNPGVDHHISLHESGELHVKSKGNVLHEKKMPTPLAEVTGEYNVLTSIFGNEDWQFENCPPRMEYRNQESDAILVIDSRSIPHDALLLVKIGVVEAGRLDALLPESIAHDAVGMTVKQIMIATSVEPWVYLMLHWGTEDEFSNSKWAMTNTQ